MQLKILNTMKKSIKTILITLLFINCKAQTTVNIDTYNQSNNTNKYFKDINNNYQNFVGTWENTTGNITFRIILWKETMKQLPNETNSFMDEIHGRFLIILNAGTPSEVTVHNSVKYYPQNGYTSNSVINGDARNSTIAGGYFEDSCANGGNGILTAGFKMTIINTGNTPLQAQWLVKSSRQLYSGESFTVPTNVVLTKQ
jgi:hypothetical protein